MTRLRLPEPVAGARLLGLGSMQPERVVTNDELAARVDTSDEWIRSRVGIESRRFAEKDTLLVEMAAEAGVRALKDSGVDPADVGAVIVATCTMPDAIPNAAAQVAAPDRDPARPRPSTSTPPARASATASPSRRTSCAAGRCATRW